MKLKHIWIWILKKHMPDNFLERRQKWLKFDMKIIMEEMIASSS